WFILLGLHISFSEISAQSVVGQYGRLRVQGNQIVDKNGDPVSLAGNSLFWSNAGDVADYYNSTTVNHLADDWNSSIVRAAMGVKETWDGGTGYIDNPQQQEAKIRKVIDAAIAKGIYVIVDWHSHEAERYQSEAVSFFRKMARLYGNRPNIIYEIYNEPINQSWSEIKTYAEAVTAAIRSEDPDNLIIVGTPFYSQRVDVASNSPLPDNNTAYTLHFYAGTHRQELRDKAIQAMNNGIALFVTEWGSVSASGDGAIAEVETQRWMDFLREKNISHANWTVADKAESSCIVQPGRGVSGLTSNQLTPSGRLVKGIIQKWSDNPGGGSENSAPAVSFISPSGDLNLQEGYDLDIEVRASDSDGSITTVALYIDDRLIRIERSPPTLGGTAVHPTPKS
ncbi:MAG: glycoside hydrolase family 5 protein, partial [Bacteroidota bacterium]